MVDENGKLVADWFEVTDGVVGELKGMLKRIHEQNVIDELLFKSQR